MKSKIIYKKKDLLGDKHHRSSAMKDIAKKDQDRRVLNQHQEKKQLFNELKKYRDGGVSEKELKHVLAGLKYGNDDHFSRKEVNQLAGELGIGRIERKHIQSKSLPHASRIDRAHHSANFVRKKNAIKSTGKRKSPGDDITHFEARNFVSKKLGAKYEKHGDIIMQREDDEIEFTDVKTGKRYYGRATQLKRPDVKLRSQSSFRGRGLIANKKI